MPRFSLREAYENGWRIDTLANLLAPTTEDLIFDPNPEDQIRRIAQTQDDQSFFRTRRYLKHRLLGYRPQRRYCPEIEPAIDSALAIFYFGEDMPEAHSLAHQRQLERAAEQRQQYAHQLQEDLVQELIGVSLEQLPLFLGEVLPGKYQADLSSHEFETILASAVSSRLQHDEKLRVQINQSNPDLIASWFARWPQITALLVPQARQAPITQPSIPSAETFASELEPMKDYPWTVQPVKYFDTRTLRVALVKRTPDDTLLIEVGKLDSPTCKRVMFRTSKFIGKGDRDVLRSLLGEHLDNATFTSYALHLVGLVKEKLL